MKPRIWRAVLAGACALGFLLDGQAATKGVPEGALVLLVPDGRAFAEPVFQAWGDAAAEEGLQLVAMTDASFTANVQRQRHIAGVILPDQIHTRASDLLVRQLNDYVKRGGHLLLTYDAAVKDAGTGLYTGTQSRFSNLTGVRYAMFPELGVNAYENGAVFASANAEKRLAIQPGKLNFKTSSLAHWGELSTYGYARLSYNHFHSRALAGATVLMRTAKGDAIASEVRIGNGAVLFVNLPLGYLKTRTDAYLLHRFLKYFATGMLALPYLATVPDAVGGLVLNLHVDSNADVEPLKHLESAGWFDNGPMSIHVTAGADNVTAGDGLGLGLDQDPSIQQLLRRRASTGHEVGDHGGWNHNLFGFSVNDDNGDQFVPFLERNHRATTAAAGVKGTAYSSPLGNQPPWITEWLASNGFKAYYTTGDIGMGPTRSYVNGLRPKHRLWAFPVSNFYQTATFEEVDRPQGAFTADDYGVFVEQLATYASDHHLARLFYVHTPAVMQHPGPMASLMAKTRDLLAQGRFRWYTMTELADFQTRREATHWEIRAIGSAQHQLSANNAHGLEHQSWFIPSLHPPLVVSGKASSRREDRYWIVTAGDCRELEVRWK